MLRRRYGTRHLGSVADVAPGLEDAALVGVLLAQQQPQEGRLARTRRADEEDELALVDVEGDVLQSAAVPLL